LAIAAQPHLLIPAAIVIPSMVYVSAVTAAQPQLPVPIPVAMPKMSWYY
jgi:hypothetical protein